MACTIGEVRAGKKREPVRGGEHAHRPAAAPGGSLHRLHVDRVEVGPLLPVDLHAHEMPVHHFRGGGVRERLVTHDVAPVARRVPDRDEKRPVQLLRTRERLVAPRVPVDGIAGVLAQVGACLATEPVHLRPPPLRHSNAFTLRNLWSEAVKLGLAARMVLVTGGPPRIGRAIAARFAEVGLGEPQL